MYIFNIYLIYTFYHNILQERPLIQQPRSFIAEVNNNNEQAIDDFLESHWEMGEDFIIEQSKNFDGMTLLNIIPYFY